jgi:2-polyprenyl-3-methyl-5-hydroxy-6-metoxy-1,4-benzoquinol methylase
MVRSIRRIAIVAVLAYWTAMYVKYRREALIETAEERRKMRTITPSAYRRHYEERVPTVEEELEGWPAYHRRRHEMRYRHVERQARRHLAEGGRILDLGCGSAPPATMLADLGGVYVGVDLGGHHVQYATRNLEQLGGPLEGVLSRGDVEAVPFADASFDLVIMTEVIEHLMEPDRCIWEIARVLRPGGVLVLTTNNASEAPTASPLRDLFAWLEKAAGATFPSLISRRPWVWPDPVDPSILDPGSGEVYVPHSHHIAGETRRVLAAAGLDTLEWSTFEFPPPQSRTADWLVEHGRLGLVLGDVLEAVCTRVPLLDRLGCHLSIVARKSRPAVASTPPAGLWPNPLHDVA